jgi:hypothetical protein
MRTRKLLTDSGEALFSGARPIALEGIPNFVTRPDLLDRAITFVLAPLANRKTREELWREFEARKAGIFGALCDMLATGVRRLSETKLVNPPRMADFATWAVACGLDGFERAYTANRQSSIHVILDLDVLASAIKALVARKPWQGTAQELLDVVGPATKITSPKSLSDQLRRLSPMLRSIGIDVTYLPRTAGRREIRICRSNR